MMARAYNGIVAAWRNLRRSEFLFDGYVISVIGVAAALHMALWYYLNAHVNPHEAFMPLHFTYAFGVDLIGNATDMYYVAYWAAAFSAVNIACARFAYRYDILAAYFLVSVVPLFHGIMLWDSFLIIQAA